MSYDFYIDIDGFEALLQLYGINICKFWILPENERIQVMQEYAQTCNTDKFFHWLQTKEYFTDIVE